MTFEKYIALASKTFPNSGYNKLAESPFKVKLVKNIAIDLLLVKDIDSKLSKETQKQLKSLTVNGVLKFK